MFITIPSFVNIFAYITAPSSLSPREEESHKIRTGLFVDISLPYKYQDPVLWVWLENFSTPKKYKF